jgi:tellurite methyltransferase
MAPSPFIAEWLARFAPALPGASRALDVAMGRGRHALPLAQAGFETFGVDINLDAVRDAVHAAASRGLVVHGWCADLRINKYEVRSQKSGDVTPSSDFVLLTSDLQATSGRRGVLPESHFDLIVVTRYLQRDLFPSIASAVRPGGIILYETFTVAQRALGRGPTSPDHLLEPGELRNRFDELDVLFYEEVSQPEAVARVVARRRSATAYVASGFSRTSP